MPLILSVPLAAALAATVPVAAPPTLAAAQAGALRPGDFVWQGATASTPGAVRIEVSLARQVAFVWSGDQLIGISTVSSGKAKHDTPTGTFPILQKHADHRSSIYNNAPMPFMQRLTWDGVALHAGKLPGYRASHGCIRLPADFAKALYTVTRVGTVVTVSD